MDALLLLRRRLEVHGDNVCPLDPNARRAGGAVKQPALDLHRHEPGVVRFHLDVDSDEKSCHALLLRCV